MKRNNLNIISFCFSVFLLSCSYDVENNNRILNNNPGKKTEWNYLIYMAADNDLEQFAIENLKEIKKIGSTQNVNIIVYFDRSAGFENKYENWVGAKVFRIRSETNTLMEDELLDRGIVDMRDENQLDWFLSFVQKNYPSKKTLLSIWSHGFGVFPDGEIKKTEISRSVIADFSTDFILQNSLSIQKVARVLRNYSVNVLLFEACLMGMIENIWELSDCVDYCISSETDFPGRGFNYSEVFRYLVNQYLCTPKDLSLKIGEAFKNLYSDNYVTLSVIDMGNFISIKEEFTVIIDTLKSCNKIIINSILNTRKKCSVISNEYLEYVDILEFFECLCCENIIPENINNKIQNFLVNLDMIYVEKNTSKKNSGLSVNIPYNNEQLLKYSNNKQDLLLIYVESGLNELILYMLTTE